ncbi:penicillin acylase family protein [Sphingomonas flavalba]|uniref:penicillin acylase family protein n=1 Tax=Sphingomonas flavalba TaxID=2559804 RepID=UPI001EF0CA0E|nr:penicillin acylase family protein [Sphingomonas flavalba]
MPSLYRAARPALRPGLWGMALALLLLLPGVALAVGDDAARWRDTAARVTITRDNWGIAHVRGKSDADAVFGAIYAQAEDDFNRVETNYITALGRLAEVEGEKAIWQDLRMRLYIDPTDLQARHAASPAWLHALTRAWADGLNYYLASHPHVRPRLITRFEPWMALAFSEGSIGGDIERIPLAGLARFYGGQALAPTAEEAGLRPREPRGSNGIAIAPRNSRDGHAMLLINPHTSFYFRSELQMTSDEGLNAYGAATWGQFFIYQGFNERAGWMHTSSGVDNIDEFAETIARREGRPHYRYGAEWRPVAEAPLILRYRTADGGQAERRFTVYRTHHGPVIGERDGKWIAIAMMFRPVAALQQSFLRTKAQDYQAFMAVAALSANSSNNTLYADANGDIAYLHPQFVPIRDDRFDYADPVDGADPATDWQGLTPLAALPSVRNPPGGWVMNTNNWPWTAAGDASPKAADFPRYMDRFGENARGVHADMLLRAQRDFTPKSLMAAAYDSYQPAFATLIPKLTAAFDALPRGDARRARLGPAIAMLRGWDYRWGVTSRPMTIAVFWGEVLWTRYGPAAQAARRNVPAYLADHLDDATALAALGEALDRLRKDFGDWRVPWGAVNRFQRLTGAIDGVFDDGKPSLPVGFASAHWGSLASFGAQRGAGTKRLYGSTGNSFVAVVEFAPRLRAWAVSAGGESGDPASPHFTDQAAAYAAGRLRPVHFYPDEIAANTRRQYRPGER